MISPKMREAPEGAPDSRLALAAKCGSVLARDNQNARRSLANGPADAQLVELSARAGDWNWRQVQLAQGGLCRTAGSGDEVIAGTGRFASGCANTGRAGRQKVDDDE
jgi:hypothetical protein